MRSALKPVHFNSLSQLSNAITELAKTPHHENNAYQLIVESAFGCPPQQGLLPPRLSLYHQQSPTQWAPELDAITNLFSPQGKFMTGSTHTGLIQVSDQSILINPNILPKSVREEFIGSGDKKSRMLGNLRRQLGDKYFIHTWEWFWCNLAHALASQAEVEQKRSLAEDQEEDELFFMLSRNPYLIIARKTLQHLHRKDSKDSHLLQRMRGVFELYFIEDLLFTTKKRGERTSDAKYYLKSHYLGMVFLLISSHRGKMGGQTMEIYQDYFLKATEYYSTLTNGSSSKIISYLLRVWGFLLTREHSLDINILKQLGNANPREGWYRLARCPLEDWTKATRKVELFSSELPVVLNTRRNFFRLLQKQGQWTPNYSFLSTFQQFIQLDKAILSPHLPQLTPQHSEVISRTFQRILVYLAEHKTSLASLQILQATINKRYKDRLGKQLDINFSERSEDARVTLSRTSRQKSSMISYQNPRMRSVWQHPVQENQFYICFQVAFWLSWQLDRLIPGHSKRTYPCLNFRIFSNPLVFFITLFLFLYSFKLIIGL